MESLFLLIVWIFLSILFGREGSKRKIGFLKAFLLSFFLSPLVGFAFLLISPLEEDEDFKSELLEVLKRQQQSIDKLSSQIDLLIESQKNKNQE